MAEKIELLSVSKSDYRNEFGLPKEQKFFEIVRKFLWKLGFEEDKYLLGYGRPWEESTEEPILNKENNIKKYVNKIDNYRNKNYSVDIIYFDKEVVLIINSKTNKQQVISKVLDEFIDWEKTN
ncbi:hypothetical protein HY449_04280 [Candidatus Pacearchaeota archaeon]|nr:hypothetical protein [Candidatus Pacearchaeota archaeon]